MKGPAQFGLGFLLCLLTCFLPGWSQITRARAQAPVVHVVLFYSPACPHCHQVITEDLPPLFEKYGDQLQIVGVDTTTPGGQALFAAAMQRYTIPPENQAVPMLFVGDQMLLGSLEIPEQLPLLIEHYLAQGGVDWPDIPGLRQALQASKAEETSAAAPTLAEPDVETPAPETPQARQAALSPTVTPLPSVTPTPILGPSPAGLTLSDPPSGLVERLALDPTGNGLAIVVLLGMILSLGGATPRIIALAKQIRPKELSWLIPILCGIGLFVASYLAYVESAQVRAVCGPVGDCNTVQQSEYARLFGVLPVGLLGLVGYVAIGVAWAVSRFGEGHISSLASLALSGMTLFGVLFSIYLTFLEPFVIGAACIWCLSSAVIMTLLLWFVVHPPARGSNVVSPRPTTSIW